MNFRPTKKKIILSLIISTVFYILFRWFYSGFLCGCALRVIEECIEDYYYLSTMPNCHCGCVSLKEVIFQNILAFIEAFLIPFIFIYFLISVDEKKKVSK